MEMLLTAISLNHPGPEEQLLRIVTTACLMHGFYGIPSGGYKLSPVSCCQIGVAVKNQMPALDSKLLIKLAEEPCKSFLEIIPGSAGTQPAVLPDVAALTHTSQDPGTAKQSLTPRKWKLSTLCRSDNYCRRDNFWLHLTTLHYQ